MSFATVTLCKRKGAETSQLCCLNPDGSSQSWSSEVGGRTRSASGRHPQLWQTRLGASLPRASRSSSKWGLAMEPGSGSAQLHRHLSGPGPGPGDFTITIIIPSHSQGNTGSGRQKGLPEATQLVGGRASVPGLLAPNPTLSHFHHSCVSRGRAGRAPRPWWAR